MSRAAFVMLGFLAVILPAPARAESLLEAYKLALQSDPKFRAAQHDALAAGTAIDQARAGLLPYAKYEGVHTDTRQRTTRRTRSATPARPAKAAVTRKAARPTPRTPPTTPCSGRPNGKISESTIGGTAAVTKPAPTLITINAATG